MGGVPHDSGVVLLEVVALALVRVARHYRGGHCLLVETRGFVRGDALHIVAVNTHFSDVELILAGYLLLCSTFLSGSHRQLRGGQGCV